MKKLEIGIVLTLVLLALFFRWSASAVLAPRQMEHLGRGLVAVRQADGRVFIGWRLLGTDPDEIAFNLYRTTAGGKPVRVNARPLTAATSFVDEPADLTRPNGYFVRPVLKGREQDAGATFTLPANAPARPYLSIPLQT